MSLGPLAVVLLLPLALVVGLRTHRWKGVIVLGSAAAIVALTVPTAAVVIVAGGLVSLIVGAVLLGDGGHAVGRAGVADQVAGGLALRWWRRRQIRRWSHAWARFARPLKL